MSGILSGQAEGLVPDSAFRIGFSSCLHLTSIPRVLFINLFLLLLLYSSLKPRQETAEHEVYLENKPLHGTYKADVIESA